MNILFLTLVTIDSLEERGIYQDLLRKFANEKHNITIVTPVERRYKIKTNYAVNDNVNILKVKTFNITKTNLFEKGIGTLAIEKQYLNAIKKHSANTKFDIVFYSTPPITFAKVIEFIKKRDNAFSYLLLKDIFPQNAVDMKMIKKNGIIHRIFLKKEKHLYAISDAIGCMSQANVDYLLKNNKEIETTKIEINPNSIEPVDIYYSELEKKEVRQKYKLPVDKTIFVYGGNLGKPQGLDFLISTIESNKEEQAFFLVVGTGTEFERINKWFQSNNPKNCLLLKGIPKQEYDLLLAACDIGLIFLHKDFLIPNFPCRLLSYLEMKKPVIAATDPNTDIGDIIEKSNCGRKVISGNINEMNQIIHELIHSNNLDQMGLNAWELLQKEFNVNRSYFLITSKKN